MTVWVAYAPPQYPEDDGVKAVGLTKMAVVRGLRERFEKFDCTVGPIKNDAVYDYVEVFVAEHKGTPGWREAATMRFDLLEYKLYE